MVGTRGKMGRRRARSHLTYLFKINSENSASSPSCWHFSVFVCGMKQIISVTHLINTVKGSFSSLPGELGDWFHVKRKNFCWDTAGIIHLFATVPVT